MAKEKERGRFVTRALEKLSTGLIGKIPVAGVVLKALVETALEQTARRYPSDAELSAKVAKLTADRALRDVDAISQTLHDLAGAAPDAREEIEKLAEAIEDPQGLKENERFREAMKTVFEKVGRETDDLEELAAAIEVHVTATGDQATAAGRDVKQASTIIERADTVIVEPGGVAPQPAPAAPPAAQAQRLRVAASKLPKTGEFVLGRDTHLRNLGRAWDDNTHNIIAFIAAGGVGKTAIVKRWRGDMAGENFRGAACVYDHSFYSQGTSDQTASADAFIREALAWFDDADPDHGSAWAKGARLAELIAKQRTLLILDGVEPLQDPETGHITDPGLRALVLGLADCNGGLCVVTSRKKLADLVDHEGKTVRAVDLANLTKATGGTLLGKLGVKGPKKELEEASEEFGNHALTVTLLGTYLARAHDGDIRKRSEIDLAAADMNVLHREHADKVMASYGKWFRDTGHEAEIAILRMIGLFTRPADGGCIRALRGEPVIPDLTDGVVELSQAEWNMAVTTLRELHLLAEANTQDPDGLDAHPLVREHFADRLRTDNAEAWKAGHNRLYEYLTGKDACPKEYPDTIEEMQPLYAAVIHGCLADRHQEALDEVYCCRIQRGDRHYNWKMLGAYGADLGTLTGFFDELWSKPVATINESDQGLVLNEAAFDLRALGRLAEAVEPFRVGLDMHVAAELWSRAARMALNLNDLQLTLGDVETAMKSADRSVEYANRGEDAFVSVVTRADLANTLHEQGRIEEAEALFQKAESIQKTEHGHEPFLYSKRGFQYCDFLLGKGGFATVIERALRTIEIAKQNNWLLDIALDHLSIGRALLGQAKNESTDAVRQAWARIDTAVDGLREAGQMDEFPRGLLARAELYTFTGEFDDARADLDEAMNIATRDPKGPMRLHITDCHLGYARLALARGAPIPLPSWSRRYAGGEPGEGTTREHLVIARKLIEETGYHRRDGELEEFERQAQRE